MIVITFSEEFFSFIIISTMSTRVLTVPPSFVLHIESTIHLNIDDIDGNIDTSDKAAHFHTF